jgi:hypothetical protein
MGDTRMPAIVQVTSVVRPGIHQQEREPAPGEAWVAYRSRAGFGSGTSAGGRNARQSGREECNTRRILRAGPRCDVRWPSVARGSAAMCRALSFPGARAQPSLLLLPRGRLLFGTVRRLGRLAPRLLGFPLVLNLPGALLLLRPLLPAAALLLPARLALILMLPVVAPLCVRRDERSEKQNHDSGTGSSDESHMAFCMPAPCAARRNDRRSQKSGPLYGLRDIVSGESWTVAARRRGFQIPFVCRAEEAPQPCRGNRNPAPLLCAPKRAQAGGQCHDAGHHPQGTKTKHAAADARSFYVTASKRERQRGQNVRSVALREAEIGGIQKRNRLVYHLRNHLGEGAPKGS